MQAFVSSRYRTIGRPSILVAPSVENVQSVRTRPGENPEISKIPGF